MTEKPISAGVVHMLSADLRNELLSRPKLLIIWESLTLLARNEWICWIESAKKSQTRERRMKRMGNDLLKGKRRPCCWPGCPHR